MVNTFVIIFLESRIVTVGSSWRIRPNMCSHGCASMAPREHPDSTIDEPELVLVKIWLYEKMSSDLHVRHHSCPIWQNDVLPLLVCPGNCASGGGGNTNRKLTWVFVHMKCYDWAKNHRVHPKPNGTKQVQYTLASNRRLQKCHHRTFNMHIHYLGGQYWRRLWIYNEVGSSYRWTAGCPIFIYYFPIHISWSPTTSLLAAFFWGHVLYI